MVLDTLRGAEKIAVVIVNYNGGALLERCLTALVKQTYTPFRTIVVDNASRDGSVDGIEGRHPAVQVIRMPKNIGFAAGNNVGIRPTEDCDWIACLNPDAFPEPDWLEQFVKAMRQAPTRSFFGCKMLKAENPDWLDGTGDVYHVSGLAWRRDHGKPVSKDVYSIEEIFGPCAAAALYPRQALLDTGGFDESYFCYYEDVDLAFRLRLKGYRCWYVPDAVVRHVGSAITGRRSDFSVYHGHRNMVWTYFKNMPALLLWWYFLPHVLLSVVTIVIFAFRGQARVILRAKWDALKGLPHILRKRKVIQATRTVRVQELRRVMAALPAFLRRG